MPLIPAWAMFATVALVFWGVTGITQKLSTNRIASELSFLWFAYAMIAISAVIALTATIHWHLSPLMMCLSVAGGTLNGLGALTSFTALESGGKASIVISLISLFPLLTVAVAVVFLHERLTPLQGVGIVLAISGAILLSIEAPQEVNSSSTGK
jgi:bacterial/archaeal transporter family protein